MVYSSGGNCTFDEKSTTPLNSAQERANCFAKFGARKFRALGGNMSDLPPLPGSPSNRDYDVLSDGELELCLAAMSSGKAAGHDGAPIEVYKHIPTCKAELFALVRAICAVLIRNVLFCAVSTFFRTIWKCASTLSITVP